MYLKEPYRTTASEGPCQAENAYPLGCRVISGQRYLHPELGRWTRRDPIEEVGFAEIRGHSSANMESIEEARRTTSEKDLLLLLLNGISPDRVLQEMNRKAEHTAFSGGRDQEFLIEYLALNNSPADHYDILGLQVGGLECLLLKRDAYNTCFKSCKRSCWVGRAFCLTLWPNWPAVKWCFRAFGGTRWILCKSLCRRYSEWVYEQCEEARLSTDV